jgi:hypothetical protein
MARRLDPTRCPSCGERVTAFAAGCALCGADLDPRRNRSGPTPMQRVESRFAALRLGPRPIYGGLTVVTVFVLAYALVARLGA